ncbi:MAG TPA: SH3 domain-containing protein [Devosia sp.]|nr:SH3 domain-containing protein [Devosia sp.]
MIPDRDFLIGDKMMVRRHTVLAVGSSRPSDTSPSIFTFTPGDEVRIAEVRGNWLRVETEDGFSAWIRR